MYFLLSFFPKINPLTGVFGGIFLVRNVRKKEERTSLIIRFKYLGMDYCIRLWIPFEKLSTKNKT